jgi:hypothetical protein
VGLGAVLVIGAKSQEVAQDRGHSSELPHADSEDFLDVPLEYVEVVGRSLLERMIERLIAIDVEHISVLVEAKSSAVAPSFRHSLESVKVRVVADMAVAIAEQLITDAAHFGSEMVYFKKKFPLELKITGSDKGIW